MNRRTFLQGMVAAVGGSLIYDPGARFAWLELPGHEPTALAAEIIEDPTPAGSWLYWNGQVIDMTPPQHVVLEVTYTEPAARGNTATNITKPATIETGAEVQVPAFINQGDKVKIDAANGTYIERVRE
jgi:hypothetical protein